MRSCFKTFPVADEESARNSKEAKLWLETTWTFDGVGRPGRFRLHCAENAVKLPDDNG